MKWSKLLLGTITTVMLMTGFDAAAAGCVGLATSSEQKNGGKLVETFSGKEIADVDLWVLFTPGSVQRFADDHTVEVRFFTPGGYLYQSIAIPFTSDAGEKKPKRLDGYPHPMPVRRLVDVSTATGRQLGVSVRLPVAGTSIVTNSLYGVWSAEAFVDGDPLRCSRAVTFVMEE